MCHDGVARTLSCRIVTGVHFNCVYIGVRADGYCEMVHELVSSSDEWDVGEVEPYSMTKAASLGHGRFKYMGRVSHACDLRTYQQCQQGDGIVS